MFIGGGSLSTASGIKIGTFIVLLAAVYSYVFHRKEVVLMKRSVSPDTVQKALALVLVTCALIFLGVLLLTILEKAPFISILFEVVSAVSTTGLSRDLIHHLSAPSQRSEEHTSELQSLMRISYAVFCLQKKNTKPQSINYCVYLMLTSYLIKNTAGSIMMI